MKFKYILFICLFSAVSLMAGQNQHPDILSIKSGYGFNVMRPKPVLVNVFVNYSKIDWKPQIFVAVAVQNDALQFEKKDTLYLAAYEVNIAIRHQNKTIRNHSLSKRVILKKFAQTNSRRRYQYNVVTVNGSEMSVSAEPYECLVEIRDSNSGHSEILRRKFNVKPNACTEIALLKQPPSANQQLPLTPTVEALNFHRDYWLYARFRNAQLDSGKLQIILLKEESGQKAVIRRYFPQLPADSAAADFLFPLPTDSLAEGRYLIRMQQDTSRREKSFRLVWFDKPTYLYRYDLALRPMRYILSEEEWKRAASLNRQELKIWFERYWRERDPTPDTAFNELLDEFFQRVRQANIKFSTRHKEGWETDRGKILILYGPPQKVENRRFATQTLPYLVWDYDNGLQFIFVDRYRTGEFSLIEKE